MLPIETEVNPQIYKQMAKFILLTGGSKFGNQESGHDHIMDRMNNFMERSKDPNLLQQYRNLYDNGNRHPDIFLDGNTNYSDHTVRYHVSEQPERYEDKRATDFYTWKHRS